MTLSLESLEPRRLLSVTVSLNAELGVLNVAGDGNSDDIQVFISHAWSKEATVLRLPPRPLVVVVDRGKEIFSSQNQRDVLGALNINKIHVNGGGGDDVIEVRNSGSTVTTLISGHHGNDQINAIATDFAPGAIVHGGAGDDSIVVSAQGGTAMQLSPYLGRVFAGAGNDSISLSVTNSNFGFYVEGGAGSDLINGSTANDLIYGDSYDERASTKLFASGNDTIVAGGGLDQLYGGAGNDLFISNDNDNPAFPDIIDGGAGFDRALADFVDIVINVEDTRRV